MYFGTTGMSLLMGSFVPKDQVPVLSAASTTTTSLSAPIFTIHSYIVILTDAAQAELDSLSAGESIAKQFKTEYPHIKKLH
jgi:hypothetical protein